MDAIETQAAELYPGAWGEQFDPKNAQSRIAMAQLVAEMKEGAAR